MKPVRITLVAPLAWMGAYHRRLLNGFAAYARLHLWTLTVVNPDSLRQLAGLDRHADGLILMPHPLVDEFARPFKCPAVCLSGAVADAPWPIVKTDDVAVGRLAAQHLIERGFRRLAFVGEYSASWWAIQRQRGFFERAGEAGLECAECGTPASARRRKPSPRAASREIAIAKWIATQPLPMGVMGCNDYWGARVIAACQAMNLKVPGDVAVIGVDDDDLHVEICNPPLSSIPHQYDRLAHEAAELLRRLIAGEAPPDRPVLIAPGALVVRQSSDTTASHDPLVAEAARFIRQHLAEATGVKDLLGELAVSRSLLDQRFHQMLGRSAAEEIRRARIERARQLLAGSDLPTPLVASQSGFSSAWQFSKTFRRETGKTPTEYRRLFRIRGNGR
ncbi:MAG TPA: DNA-binding transcriptional regulator [Tepidisphaeraceae bacterium]|jgi:LacI family transcriptional regulator|nr:DNA-binding transcriptional regulator [Tepidisphaeraceae bacterium]